jgi:penicillin-binding protein 2
MDPNKAIPSMFHRRLLLLTAVIVVVTLIQMAQMVRLSVVQGASRLAVAESRLDRRTYLPTYRGRVLDRHERVLAVDRASYDVAVEYDVLTGTWVRASAVRQARKDIGRKAWSAMSPQEREAAIAARVEPWEKRREQLWQAICKLGNITNDEVLRRIDAVKADVQVKAASQWARQFQAEQAKYGISEDEFKPGLIREQTQPHVILPRVPDEVAFELRRLQSVLPDMFEVQDSRRREYPWLAAAVPLDRSSLPLGARSDQFITIEVKGVADHILGSMRDEVWASDIQQRPFANASSLNGVDLGGYRLGDSVGERGIERVFEDHLRGTRGMVMERLATGERTRVDAQPGHDVQVTIDIALQARVQAILSPQFGLTRVQPWQSNAALPLGTPLNSAAVVMEVETGEILAMVSMPTRAMGQDMNEAQRQIHSPMSNRAAEAVYPPGSIIKPFTLAAAVTEGLHSIDAPITCNGKYFPNLDTHARCWIYREKFGMQTHGPLLADEALARSCNIFFFTLADRLGMQRFTKSLGDFGLGRVLDVGLRYSTHRDDGTVIWVGENSGSLPDQATVDELRKKGQLKFAEVIMGIGQGPLTWTPLQAANAYATLARGGVIRDATLVTHDPRGSRPARVTDLKLSPSLVQTTLEGLRQSVMERFGTGHHISHGELGEEPIINAQDVTVWAKTGTAQAPPLRPRDTNGDGQINSKDEGINGLDHSWFVGLVGPKGGTRPLHAIAVVVEYGGSGGRTAGPVANQIIRALQAEGYLPGDPHAAPPGGPMHHVVAPEPDDEDEGEAPQ